MDKSEENKGEKNGNEIENSNGKKKGANGGTKIDRTVLCFFVLFLSVYFLESIGGFYMTSAIVSIEKQFQIPSKISGMMVSAGDFGYIPAVVFVSYLGSKGNRARWIGGGCTLIAIANLMISASHFLFPVEQVQLNTSTLETEIERDMRRLPAHIQFDQFLAELPSDEFRQRVRQKINPEHLHPELSAQNNYQLYWISEFEHCIQSDNNKNKNGTNSKLISNAIDPAGCHAFYKFLHKHNAANKSEMDNLRLLSATSYAFCDKTLNSLRNIIEQIRCGRDISNVGPTATIFLGLLILGIGRTMPFSLGLPLIDDNVRKSNLPLYFAGMFCIRIMGPMLGFGMGSVFNMFYYTGKAPHGITPKDPMWIGRWWGGFLAIGCVMFLPSLMLSLFPNQQQQQQENEEKEEGENVGTEQPKKQRGLALVDRHLEKSENDEKLGMYGMCQDFFQTITTVLQRPIYRWAMAGRIIDVMAFKGFHIFLPKYLELQFGIPQYEVNRLMGIIGVLSFAVGVLCGSLAMRRLRLQGRRAAAWVAMVGALSACFSLINSMVGCKSTMTALGESLENSFNSSSACLVGCHCESAPLYPVCDRDGTVFYSPCHAGCQLTNASAFLTPMKTPIFDGCGCANSAQVSREFCMEDDCRNRMYWYFANMAMGGVIGGMGVVPGVLIMLRSVPPKHRSISLGFNGFLVSLLATLPSPIIWGAIIDHFCLFWTNRCDERGACALYATNNLQVWLHSLYGALRMFSLITDLFVIYHAKGLKLTDSESDEIVTGKEGCRENNLQKRNNGQKTGEKKNALDREQSEPLKSEDVHVHSISCAPPSYKEDEEQNKMDKVAADGIMDTKRQVTAACQKSASLPRDMKPGHKRNASKDISAGLMTLSQYEFEAIRKTSSHHPISKF